MAGYLEHFHLRAAPFSSSPDPEFAYATREHQLAVAKIQYGVEEKQGLFLLQGEIGSGKTTISQFLMNNWRSDPQMRVAHMTNPSVRTPSQFIRLILSLYGQPPPYLLQDNWDALRALLVENFKEGLTTTLIIDEAQAISSENLETLTHISNEQTQKSKLIQIVLLAQPNIVRKLASKPALRDRIAHGSTLNALSFEDAAAMMDHRLKVAGATFGDLFDISLLRPIYNSTKGIPRRICMLCDNILFNAFMLRKPLADEEDLNNALQDLSFKGWRDPKEEKSKAEKGNQRGEKAPSAVSVPVTPDGHEIGNGLKPAKPASRKEAVRS